MRLRITTILIAAATLLVSLPAAAQNIPSTMNYVGNLSDDGQPVNKTVSMTFEFYDAKTGGTAVWSESKSAVDINDGRFAAELGTENPLDEVFDGEQYWLEVTVDGEAMKPRTPAGLSPYAVRAGSVGQVDYDNSNSGLNADTQQAAIDELKSRIDSLESKLQDKADKSALDQKADKSALQNKADKSELQDYAKKSTLSDYLTKQSAQNTYATKQELSKKANKSTLQNYYTQVETDNKFLTQQDLNDYYTKVEADTRFANKSSLNNYYTTSQTDAKFASTSDFQNLQSRVGSVEDKTQDMTRTSINGKRSVAFDGVNVYVRNGQNGTDQTNGRGNLIVGYNDSTNAQSGSHNLVIGDGHKFTSYGGFVGGEDNTISSKYATVITGERNTASSKYAIVASGEDNTASGDNACVVGGEENIASGSKSCVLGGDQNQADGLEGSILGGYKNAANDHSSVVSGGTNNVASGWYSTVSGGDGDNANSRDEWCAAGTCR